MSGTKYIVTFRDKSMMVVDNLFEYGMFTPSYRKNDTISFTIKIILFWLVFFGVFATFHLLFGN